MAKSARLNSASQQLHNRFSTPTSFLTLLVRQDYLQYFGWPTERERASCL